MHAVLPCVVEIRWKMPRNLRNLYVFAGVYPPMVDAIRQPVSMCWQIRHASRCSHGPDPLLSFFALISPPLVIILQVDGSVLYRLILFQTSAE